MRIQRLVLAGGIAVVFVLAIAISAYVAGKANVEAVERPRQVNVLQRSDDQCVVCHRRTTPGIVEQYGVSAMARAKVTCRDCHEVEKTYPGAVEHEGTYVLRRPTTAVCQKCHQKEVAEFYQSRHSLPAYVAYAGARGLNAEQLKLYQSIPEGTFVPEKMRNALYSLEGPEITRFACRSCHDIGRPNPDGSIGRCTKCHLRHEFSLEQARKPETCNACHIGPDHPQWEIYQESPHGIMYLTGGDRWNWDTEPGRLTIKDLPAPTCAICHMSGFGKEGTTHDVGDRLTWYLFAPISTRRPAWQDNRTRMQEVCFACHNRRFVQEFYAAADKATEKVNEWVRESNKIIAPLKERGLLTPKPFDEPIDFTYFNLWHHWGRTAKFGVWMQGADYVQWHGAYEILHDLAELRKMVKEKLEKTKDEEK